MNCKAPEINGCPNEATTKGFCNKHYQRWRNHGDPLVVLPRSGNKTKRSIVTWRVCIHCRYEGPADHFMPKRNKCKRCNTDLLAKWKTDHPVEAEAIRQANRAGQEFRKAAKRLGLDPKEMEQRWSDHNGKCEICQRVPSKDERRLHMDHDHVSGKFRGFLCNNCNAGIGRFLDSPSLLRAAAKYLEDRQCNTR